jgi:flavin-dependent dehydrogenase
MSVQKLILLGAAERAGVNVRVGVTVTKINEDRDRVDVQFSTQRQCNRDPTVGPT